MSRVLLLGAGGMLGHKILQEAMSVHEVTGTIRSSKHDRPYDQIPMFGGDNILDEVDVAESGVVGRLVSHIKPEVVINCVGVIKQRPEATSPIPSISTNSLLPHVLAEQCRDVGARLIHFSTDCVFDGRKGGYNEGDPSTAEDLYGRSKYLGEVEGRHNALTLRTSIIGRELANFQSLVEWFLRQEGGEVHGYRRALYSGVTTNWMATLITRIIDEYPQLHGLFHVVGPMITKHDLLVLIRSAYGLNIRIVPEDSVVVDRSMNGSRFQAATGIVAPPWTEMVTDMANDSTPYEDWR